MTSSIMRMIMLKFILIDIMLQYQLFFFEIRTPFLVNNIGGGSVFILARNIINRIALAATNSARNVNKCTKTTSRVYLIIILTGNEATIEGESRYTKFLPNPAPPFFCLLTRTVHRSTQRYSYTAQCLVAVVYSTCL